MSGYGAWATEALSSYAPLSYIICAMLGALLFAAILVAFAWFRAGIARAQWMREASKKSCQVNPVDTTFNGVRINLQDLLPPAGNIISGKTFIDCEIIVNSNVFLAGPFVFNGPWLGLCEGVRVRDDAELKNAIGLADCSFIRGSVFRMTILIPERFCDQAKANMPDLIWITPE